LSRSRIIPADRASGLSGWALGDFAAPRSGTVRDEPADPAEAPDDAPPAREVEPPPLPPEPPGPSPEVVLREELEAARAEAREAGFEAGREAGYATGEAEAAALRLLVGHLRELVEDLEQGIASDVLSLSLELAKQIVRTSLRVRPDLVMAVIREVSKGFQGLGESPKLILHPADATLVRQSVEADPAGEWPWIIVEDGAVERGGCKFQTGASEIDATLETRWRRVVASLGRDDAWLDLNL
jgi:flagellar assembly protein FliH